MSHRSDSPEKSVATTSNARQQARPDRMMRLETVPRLKEEKRTMEAMVSAYCRAHHGAKDDLCESCADFLAYSLKRLACCPFGAEKPVCAKCKIHCYKPEYKVTARDIMRWAGPRLLFSHPVLTLKHLWYSATIESPDKPRNSRR